eukprot:3461378-Pleurochrysis_carterae.AAC.1
MSLPRKISTLQCERVKLSPAHALCVEGEIKLIKDSRTEPTVMQEASSLLAQCEQYATEGAKADATTSKRWHKSWSLELRARRLGWKYQHRAAK